MKQYNLSRAWTPTPSWRHSAHRLRTPSGLHPGRRHRHEGGPRRRRGRRVHQPGPAGLLHPGSWPTGASGPEPRATWAPCCSRRIPSASASWRTRVLRRGGEAPSASYNANKVRKQALRVILNGLEQDAAMIISPHQRLYLCVDQVRLQDQRVDHRQRDRPLSTASGPRCAAGADDVREGVAIMHHEEGGRVHHRQLHQPHPTSTSGGRHLQKECWEAGQVLLRGLRLACQPYPASRQHGRRPASYGMTDTMGRILRRVAWRLLRPRSVEMMGLIGMGNNPIVGATVAVAVAIAQAGK